MPYRKQLVEERVYFTYTFPITVHHEKQGRNSNTAGTWRQDTAAMAMERWRKNYLVPHGLLNLLSYKTKVTSVVFKQSLNCLILPTKIPRCQSENLLA